MTSILNIRLSLFLEYLFWNIQIDNKRNNTMMLMWWVVVIYFLVVYPKSIQIDFQIIFSWCEIYTPTIVMVDHEIKPLE